MASLKNVAKANQRVHRERAQPEARKHLGELEKKKDYKQRAKNYNDKKAALKALHKEAIQKNPDEFYFHMVNSRVKDGVHEELEKEDNVNTPEQTLLMESRDLKYVQHMLHLENKKIEKLKASLQMPGSGATRVNKHIIFVESKKQALNYKPRRILERPSTSELSITKEDIQVSTKERKTMYKELLKRTERAKELQVVMDKLKVRKDIANTKRQKVYLEKKGTESRAPVYRWAYERKK